jgi:hypothetical protein
MPGSQPTGRPPRNPRSRRFIAAAQRRKEESDQKGVLLPADYNKAMFAAYEVR